MSRKTRIKLCSTVAGKQRDIKMLKGFGANNVSYERSKRGEFFVLANFKREIDLNKFQDFAEQNSLKYE